jgi:heptosyltransferase III
VADSGGDPRPCRGAPKARGVGLVSGPPFQLSIHPGALGDVLLAVPALRALRAARADSPLVLAAQPQLGALLTALGVVDAHVSFEGLGLGRLFVDDGEPACVEALRAASSVVCWFAARDPVFVRRLSEEAPGAVVASPVGDGSRPVWEHLLATVGAAGEWNEPIGVPAVLARAGRAALDAVGWDGATPLVVIHPGAGGLGKRWPADGFARAAASVARARRIAFVLNQGPADADAVAALASRLPGAPVLTGLALTELAGALTHAAAWLGNDSGVSHLAASVGTPALVTFQAENRAWRPWCAAARSVPVAAGTSRDEDVDAVAAGLRALLDAGA